MSVSIAEIRRLNMSNIRRTKTDRTSNIRRTGGGRFASARSARRYNPLRFESSEHAPSQHCRVAYTQATQETPSDSQHCVVSYTYESCPSSPCIPESAPASPEVFEVAWHAPDWFEEGSPDSPIEID